ncbi:unnamed protein product [Eruca vesicaria subsp. sativa]|uniref:Malectin-like domain-containing protein n=1 Tax=Eruca vesicaria subsp. sativa TaxID=29727 RepID=A0ABC8IND4_ERUVS|nr:unnamed protein product [Eruca vesicaria subsp. sativa]
MEKHPRALRLCAFICITFFSVLHLVEAQDQKGFISLDCGLSPNEPPFNDSKTGLTYSTDDGFVQTGKTGKIQKELAVEATYRKIYWTLRYFPDGKRNCYTLNVTEGTSYLITALFVYGNYDGLNMYPRFDLHLGPNFWETIDMSFWTKGTFQEIIYKTTSKFLQVCLVKTGPSNPMISSLELRPLNNNTYNNTQSVSLRNLRRHYFSTAKHNLRYQSCPFDSIKFKIWFMGKLSQLEQNLELIV